MSAGTRLLDTTFYAAFSGATGKRDIIRALLAAKDNPSLVMNVIAKINNTALAGLTDAATIYDPADSFSTASS